MDDIAENVGSPGADPGLSVGAVLSKYTARVSAREMLCATPTFDVIHDMLYEEKVKKIKNRGYNNIKSMHRYKKLVLARDLWDESAMLN